MEPKIDSISRTIPAIYTQLQNLPSGAPLALRPEVSGDSETTTATLFDSHQPSPMVQRRDPYRYVSAVHKMMAWPAVRQTLEDARPRIPDLQAVFWEPDFLFDMLERQGQGHRLPREALESITVSERISLGVPADDPRLIQLTDLSYDVLEDRARIYFNTFNRIHPVLDRQYFLEHVLLPVIESGFGESAASTLVCFVLALAEVALADAGREPFPILRSQQNDTTVYRPPGLAFFNEGRRLLGFSVAESSLENIQAYILAGNSAELRSSRGDQILRSFWYCLTMETGFNLELELPLTGLQQLEAKMGMPTFPNDVVIDDDHLREQVLGDSVSQYIDIYLYHISLRNLAVKIHDGFKRIVESSSSGPGSAIPEPCGSIVNELATLLDMWHRSLPEDLTWDRVNHGAIFQAPQLETPGEQFYIDSIYTTGAMHGLESAPVPGFLAPESGYPNSNDVLHAILRSRYYHLEHLLYRPFFYKALHYPEELVKEDCVATATFLNACLLWPITLPPASSHKRLIPCPYFWTQNIMGILIILHISRKNPTVYNIRRSYCKPEFDNEAKLTVELCISWIRDLRDSDASARWCWNVLKGLYRLED
ncbi:hypothetical protein CCHL11_05056 [Colletotrichum chlorophyti]|uniref:Transcription factor domain-containing protein n=1 Tax=Colletotrichum chlorophyti TaxID=708187 RepID=A0A1Q8S378_9PEZI|nr:hypothetical protein CCHL11_05056 [Colletotrichum chlorophyti]